MNVNTEYKFRNILFGNSFKAFKEKFMAIKKNGKLVKKAHL